MSTHSIRNIKSQVRRQRLTSRQLPTVEPLETRTVPSLNLAPVVGLQSLTGTVGINSVAVDASGDTFMTGVLEGGSTNLNPDGSADLYVEPGSSEGFLAKYSPDDQLLWYKTFSDADSLGFAFGAGNGLTLDAEGNPIVTGTCASAVYVAKFLSSGSLDWAYTFGNLNSGNQDTGDAVAVDAAGNVYIAGAFSDTSLDFGGTASTLTRQGVGDMFVAKLSGSGDPIWSWDGGSSGDQENMRGIAVDSAGEAFVTGQVTGDLGNSLYIAKLNASGTFVKGGPFAVGAATGVAIDAQGNVYVVGTVSSGTVDWGGNVGNVTYTQPDNAFTLQMDASLTPLNVGTMAGDSFGTGVAAGDGNVYVTGSYDQGGSEYVYVSYRTAGAPGSDTVDFEVDSSNFYEAPDIAANASGQIALAGAYTGSPVLERGALPSATRTAAFLATSGSEVATPTINWPSAASIVYGTALSGTQLDATTTFDGSTLSGTFTYSPAQGTILGAGTNTLSVTFTPTDTSEYYSVSGQTTLVVRPATPTISWVTPAAITYGTALSGTQLDATATFDGSMLSGTFTYSPATGKILGAGTNTLSVTFTPTDTSDYYSVFGQTTLVVSPATPTPTPPTPTPTPPQVVGIAGTTGSHKRLTSITIASDEAINAISLQNGYYALLEGVSKRKRIVFSKIVGIRSVGYDGNAQTVTIRLAAPTKGPIEVIMPGGIVSANGAIDNAYFSAVVG
jgi:hypothetical protein